MNICISRQLFVTPVCVWCFAFSVSYTALASFLQNHPASVLITSLTLVLVSVHFTVLCFFASVVLLLGTLFAAAVSSLK